MSSGIPDLQRHLTRARHHRAKLATELAGVKPCNSVAARRLRAQIAEADIHVDRLERVIAETRQARPLRSISQPKEI